MIEIAVAGITFAGVVVTTVANVVINKQNVKKEDLVKEINKVQLDNCKNYLVHAIAKANKGEELSIIERERYWENYDTYTRLGGNSYVKSSTEMLKKEGKIWVIKYMM